jgi:hypothetical protein
VISVHILYLGDCLATTVIPQPTEITQFIFGLSEDQVVSCGEQPFRLVLNMAELASHSRGRSVAPCNTQVSVGIDIRKARQKQVEMVEADQAERLAAASPTVAAAGVEGLVDGNSVRFSRTSMS